MVVIGKAQLMAMIESGDGHLLSFHAKVSWSIDDSDTVTCVSGAVAGARGFDVPPALMTALRVGAS